MELWGQHFYKLLENMSKNLNKKNMAISSEQIEQEILLRSKKEFSRKAPPKDFKDLPEIPAERYVNESFNDLEKDVLIEQTSKRIISRIGYPCFIKPANLGS